MTASRWILAVILVLAAAAAAAYWYFRGRDIVYRLSEAQLQESLESRVPLEKTYFFVIHVVLDHPRVTLVDGSDRVNVGIDVSVGLPVIDKDGLFRGTVDASGGVRYDPATAQFFLTNPTVDALALPGVPEKDAVKISAVLSQALTDYYATRPVYTLQNGSAKLMAARLLLKSVRVEHRQLVLVLGVG